MSEPIKDYSSVIEKINSNDASQRREAAEELFSENIPDDVAKILASKINDPDKGVRDAVSMSLMYNENTRIPEYVVPFISSEDIIVRNLAGEILIKRGLNSIDAMLDYLDKGDDDDKKFLIDIFALIGDKKPQDDIIRILRETENENVALACIEALGGMKVEEGIPDLKKSYEENELYRPTIIESLGKIGSREVLEFILDKYSDADDLTKFSMHEAFGNVGDEETYYFLLSKIKVVQPPVTYATITSINKLKQKLDLELPFDESTKNALLTTLREGEDAQKRAAAELVKHFKDNEVMDGCLTIYGDDLEINENLKSLFFENPELFYGRIGEFLNQNQKNLNALLNLLKEIIEEDQGEKIRALDNIKLHNIYKKLSECLGNPDEEIRRTAMELLFFIDHTQAFVFIDQMISDNNTWNKLRLIDLLEGIENQDSNEALKLLLQDDEEMIRQRVDSILKQRDTTDSTRK